MNVHLYNKNHDKKHIYNHTIILSCMQVNTYVSASDYEYLSKIKPINKTTSQQMSDCIREWIALHKQKTGE